MKRLRKLTRESVLREELQLESEIIKQETGSFLTKIRAFLIRPTRQLINVGLILAVVLSLTIGVVAQNTVTKIEKTGNLSFTEGVKEKTQELYYSDTRTIASAASDFSTFALGGKVEVEVPDNLPESSLAVVDDVYLAKPNIPVTGVPGTPRKEIITYTVQGGDTLISIARKFNINTDTILWANSRLELQASGNVKIEPGNRLTILPVNGVLHVVQDGETLKGIVKRYHGSLAMTRNFNRLDSDKVKPGQKLIIPDGRKAKPQPIEEPEETQIADNNNYSRGYSTSSYGYVPRYSGGSGGWPYGYCTWYAANARGDVTWRGNAGQWYWNARAQGRAVGSTPVPGAIVCTWESGWGHVGVVSGVHGGGRFTITEMNYAGWGVVSQRTVTTGSIPLIGFIY
ncbi:LysM peptidoglycan-binding domain-containing protein [Patescibacteria group bacterium]|nr:MAG: LysM peptidoglycan-binding domain-containing protein [Patescibacteria group bacterium]